MNWDAATAICTGAAAIFTAVMAWFTRRSIVESHAQFEKTRAQSEQHHQDGFRPIVVMVPQDGIDPLDRSNLVSIDPSPRTGGLRLCTIVCGLHNVGVGPALNIRLQLRLNGHAKYGVTRELTPVQAGEHRGDAAHPLHVWIKPTLGFNEADMQFANGMGWDLVIEYEDVFGNAFHTIHCKNPELPWTECGRGRAP